MNQPPHPGHPPLTDSQRTRLEFARSDLEYARSEDLSQLPPDGLILLIEKLRRRLDDALALVDEVTSAGQRPPQHDAVEDRHPSA